jgi:hypothetical protein
MDVGAPGFVERVSVLGVQESVRHTTALARRLDARNWVDCQGEW